MTRQEQIGFSQRVRLEWLERTASLILAGNDPKAIQAALQALLADRLSIGGKAIRGNREKAITILMKTWLLVPDGLESFRDEGMELLKRLPENQHLAIHWGMTMAVYPFFGQIAEQIGRLLRLQGDFTATHLQRRVREKYGQRETVYRAARRTMRSMVDWGVLSDAGEKGHYQRGKVCSVKDRAVAVWLVEAVIRSNGDASANLRSLCDSPCLYPVRLPALTRHDLQGHPRLDCQRQGLDQDVVRMRG